MDASLLDVALAALSVLLEPERLFYLGMGTVIGLALGKVNKDTSNIDYYKEKDYLDCMS